MSLCKPLREYTALQALALLIDAQLSKAQYIRIQSGARERNANIYPPYYRILAAKKAAIRTMTSSLLVIQKWR